MTDQGAALRDEIDQVMVKLQEDGTLKKLSEQFFGADHSPGWRRQSTEFINSVM
jgi:ABC-type amino acid transport substrate-binding protein